MYMCASCLLCIHVHMLMSAYVRTCLFISVLTVYTCLCVHVCIQVSVFGLTVYMCKCIHVCIQVCVFASAHCVYVYVSMSANKCIYTLMCISVIFHHIIIVLQGRTRVISIL